VRMLRCRQSFVRMACTVLWYVVVAIVSFSSRRDALRFTNRAIHYVVYALVEAIACHLLRHRCHAPLENTVCWLPRHVCPAKLAARVLRVEMQCQYLVQLDHFRMQGRRTVPCALLVQPALILHPIQPPVPLVNTASLVWTVTPVSVYSCILLYFQRECVPGAVACSVCPPGARCPNPSSPPLTCATGSFSVGAQTACYTCPAGYACPDVSQNIQIECVSGTYAAAGSSVCTVWWVVCFPVNVV
jgi:hypothetical protein